MARELTYKDMCEILSNKCYVGETTVERLLENLVLLIASELQNNSYINIRNVGKFKTELKGGCDEWVEDGFGKLRKKYIQPFNYVEFEPSSTLVDIVNGDSINYMFRKTKTKYEHPTAYEDIVDQNKEEKDLTDQINTMLDRRGKKNKKRRERKEYNPNNSFAEYNKDKQIRVLCKNNNVIYPSIYKASLDLGLADSTLRLHLKEGGDMKLGGYEFEILEREEEKDNG